MSEIFLHRDDTPFGSSVWEAIDEAVVGAARSQLSARRILEIEGPYGLGLKVVPESDLKSKPQSTDDGVELLASCAIPVAMLRKTFQLPARDIAAAETSGLPLHTMPAAEAAVAVARQEDALLFAGIPKAGVEGLLSAKGAQNLKLSSWDEVGSAADDLIKAMSLLDGAGYHGPYALALETALYNRLFRRYRQGNLTEIDQVRSFLGDSVVKAPGIATGGVLVAAGRQFASIVLGQDIMTGFIGPEGGNYEFSISESVALRLRRPDAVCVLKV